MAGGFADYECFEVACGKYTSRFSKLVAHSVQLDAGYGAVGDCDLVSIPGPSSSFPYTLPANFQGDARGEPLTSQEKAGRLS
jgi:hypothetical protein